MSNLARVPSGIPTGGQFAPTARSESPISLAPPPSTRHFAVLDEYQVNPDFTFPQANDLEKVVLVPDAVANGANTADSIAEALDVHPREGGYYANAAGYLGLINKDTSEAVHVYGLTGIGEAMRHADENTRAEMVAQMVEQVPEVQIFAEEGEESLRAAIASTDLTGDTVPRRAACIRSWVRATDDRTGLSMRISESAAGSSGRWAGAAEKARSQIAAAKAMRRPEPVYTMCKPCNMALPATGICDNCG